MSAIIAGIEKQLAELALKHLPLTAGLFVVVVVLAVVVTIRYNKKITEAQADRELLQLVVRQQVKIIRLLTAEPCISKKNATWLSDPKQSGQVPDQPKCSYANAIEKGKIR